MTDNKTIQKCSNCKFWDRQDEDQSIGSCGFLSGKQAEGKSDEYPNFEKTGIESYPTCVHDGPGFFYDTKEWFGCIGFKSR